MAQLTVPSILITIFALVACRIVKVKSTDESEDYLYQILKNDSGHPPIFVFSDLIFLCETDAYKSHQLCHEINGILPNLKEDLKHHFKEQVNHNILLIAKNWLNKEVFAQWNKRIGTEPMRSRLLTNNYVDLFFREQIKYSFEAYRHLDPGALITAFMYGGGFCYLLQHPFEWSFNDPILDEPKNFWVAKILYLATRSWDEVHDTYDWKAFRQLKVVCKEFAAYPLSRYQRKLFLNNVVHDLNRRGVPSQPLSNYLPYIAGNDQDICSNIESLAPTELMFQTKNYFYDECFDDILREYPERYAIGKWQPYHAAVIDRWMDSIEQYIMIENKIYLQEWSDYDAMLLVSNYKYLMMLGDTKAEQLAISLDPARSPAADSLTINLYNSLPTPDANLALKAGRGFCDLFKEPFFTELDKKLDNMSWFWNQGHRIMRDLIPEALRGREFARLFYLRIMCRNMHARGIKNPDPEVSKKLGRAKKKKTN